MQDVEELKVLLIIIITKYVFRIINESLSLLNKFPDLRVKLLPLMEDFLIELRLVLISVGDPDPGLFRWIRIL